MRILIVEDHPDTLGLLEKLLQQDGHEVTGVTSVDSAMKIAANWKFDTLLCDLGLADGNGWSLLGELKKRHQFVGLAMSGHGFPEDLERSRAAGFERHFVKPFDLGELRPVLEKICGRIPCMSEAKPSLPFREHELE